MQKNRGKHQNGKAQRSLQENQRYQGNISCKDGHNKGQKQYGPNKSRRYLEEVAKIHRRTVQKSLDPDNHDAVFIHLESDILESEVKWALGSITTDKARECDGITAELF